MRDGSPALPRVIVYVFASPLLSGDEDPALGAELDEICTQGGLFLVDRVVDRGPPKTRRNQYPVLGRIGRGEADALLVVRSPLYRRDAVADRLESACAEGPFAWLAAEDLRQAGLLPPVRPPVTAPRRRAPTGKRAPAPRAAGPKPQSRARPPAPTPPSPSPR